MIYCAACYAPKLRVLQVTGDTQLFARPINLEQGRIKNEPDN